MDCGPTSEARAAWSATSTSIRHLQAALLLPDMSAAEFEVLVADIKENGLREPVVVDRAGRLLDGRHRVRACAQLGIQPATTVDSGDDPVGCVASLNVVRRNLTAPTGVTRVERMVQMTRMPGTALPGSIAARPSH